MFSLISRGVPDLAACGRELGLLSIDLDLPELNVDPQG